MQSVAPVKEENKLFAGKRMGNRNQLQAGTRGYESALRGENMSIKRHDTVREGSTEPAPT